ncbi:MAG: hypothetical protein EHM17_17375 [Verrucomicrobiaceae bacterium]|nr:MAG: hypothetical protein EHM17_17375 [Verrucomicrobiaceae bacterium]
MSKWMQKAIAAGSPEFRSYAEYVTESMADVTLPVLRDMFKHNASVREYQEHQRRCESALNRGGA